MSLNTLLTQLRELLLIAAPCALILCVLFFALYRFIFHKNIKLFKAVPCFLFLVNLMLIIYLTFLSRSESYGTIDLHLFRSYREAWNTFSTRNWQLVLFNIALFSPLGLLLPILCSKFRKVYRTVGLGFFFSLSIELGQRITQRGLCELDDLFNNTLGVLLGYCIFYIFHVLFQKGKHKVPKMAAALLPLILTTSVFFYIFYEYNTQPYGNLPVNYTYRVDLSQTNIIKDESLNLKKEEIEAPIYVPNKWTKQDAALFASNLLDHMGISGNTHYSHYEDFIICYRGHHNITVYLDDQSYEYHYINDKNAIWGNMGAQAVKDRLSLYGIEIPSNAVYSHPAEGTYQWTVERSIASVGDISGTLTCYTTIDGQIYSINNQLIRQSVYKNEPIISETDAYERLKNGYFQIDHNYQIDDLVINDVTLTYSPDTKGYYQPVYLFKCEINGENHDLVIPALK